MLAALPGPTVVEAMPDTVLNKVGFSMGVCLLSDIGDVKYLCLALHYQKAIAHLPSKKGGQGVNPNINEPCQEIRRIYTQLYSCYLHQETLHGCVCISRLCWLECNLVAASAVFAVNGSVFMCVVMV